MCQSLGPPGWHYSKRKLRSLAWLGVLLSFGTYPQMAFRDPYTFFLPSPVISSPPLLLPPLPSSSLSLPILSFPLLPSSFPSLSLYLPSPFLLFPLPLLSLLSPSSPPSLLNTGSCYVALVLSRYSRLNLNSWKSSCFGLLSVRVPGILQNPWPCLLSSCIVSQDKKSCSMPAGWDL